MHQLGGGGSGAGHKPTPAPLSTPSSAAARNPKGSAHYAGAYAGGSQVDAKQIVIDIIMDPSAPPVVRDHKGREVVRPAERLTLRGVSLKGTAAHTAGLHNRLLSSVDTV